MLIEHLERERGREGGSEHGIFHVVANIINLLFQRRVSLIISVE